MYSLLWNMLNGVRKLNSTGEAYSAQNPFPIAGEVGARGLYSDRYIPNFFAHTNPEYGSQMAQDASFTGDTEVIYAENLGAEDEWNVTVVQGANWNLASTVNPDSGTVCILADGMADGDEIVLQNGGVSGFVAIQLRLSLNRFDETKNQHLDLTAWDSIGGVIGNPVRIENFVNRALLGEFQTATIALADLGITPEDTVSYFTITAYTDPGVGIAPIFQLDNISLKETGGGVQYTVGFPPGVNFYITHIKAVFYGAWDGTLIGSPNGRIVMTNLFNIAAIANGVSNTIISGGNEIQGIIIRSLLDMTRFPESTPLTLNTDGVNSQLVYLIKYDEKPLLLRGDSGDKSVFTFSDDLSGIGSLEIILGGKIEFVS